MQYYTKEHFFQKARKASSYNFYNKYYN